LVGGAAVKVIDLPTLAPITATDPEAGETV
jgi:hypothetical protein